MEENTPGRPAGATETLVRLGDHDTPVWDNQAAGPPMLLVHALGMDRRFWQRVYPPLAVQGRVIAYDLRGHGRASGAPLTESIDQLAEDAGTLLDTLGISQADVYGASYGGAVAQVLALRCPTRVRSLALIGTAARWPRQELERRAEAAETQGMTAQVASSLARWFLPETLAQEGWAVRYARERVEQARVEEWAAAWRAMAPLDVRDRLGEIRVPSWVVSGQQDQSAKPEVMRELASKLPQGEYRSVDPGSHFMPLDQPQALANEFVAFRRQMPSGR